MNDLPGKKKTLRLSKPMPDKYKKTQSLAPAPEPSRLERELGVWWPPHPTSPPPTWVICHPSGNACFIELKALRGNGLDLPEAPVFLLYGGQFGRGGYGLVHILAGHSTELRINSKIPSQ